MLLEQRESTDLLLAPQTDEKNKQLRRAGENERETETEMETRWRQDGCQNPPIHSPCTLLPGQQQEKQEVPTRSRSLRKSGVAIPEGTPAYLRQNKVVKLADVSARRRARLGQSDTRKYLFGV